MFIISFSFCILPRSGSVVGSAEHLRPGPARPGPTRPDPARPGHPIKHWDLCKNVAKNAPPGCPPPRLPNAMFLQPGRPLGRPNAVFLNRAAPRAPKCCVFIIGSPPPAPKCCAFYHRAAPRAPARPPATRAPLGRPPGHPPPVRCQQSASFVVQVTRRSKSGKTQERNDEKLPFWNGSAVLGKVEFTSGR